MESPPSQTYLNEAQSLLDEVETCLLDLERNLRNLDLVDRIFRAVHTIKGSGAMFGFERIVDFTHHLETLLEHARQGTVPVTGDLVDAVLASRDHVQALLEGEAEVDPEATAGLVGRLIALAGEGEAQPSGPSGPVSLPPIPAGRVRYRIRFRPGGATFRHGTNPALLIDALRELGECRITPDIGGVPPLDRLDPEHCYLGWEIVLTTGAGIGAVEDVFLFVAEESLLEIEAEESLDRRSPRADRPERLDQGGVRVPPEKLDRLINLVGELVVAQAGISRHVFSGEADAEGRETDRVDPVDTVALDPMFDPDGGASALREALVDPVEALDRLVRELRDCVLDIRMVPIGSIFGRFRRLVRDLSGELGKSVDLTTEGGETELDKTVIDRLNDPLIHLIRNCIDHAIERPDRREAAGKPRSGTIHLSAGHQGPDVRITVADDGAGLDTEVIRRKGVEKGMIPQEAEPSRSELLSLIFAPGFTTADRVSCVSGRGVGLDVVKREVEGVGGTLHVASERGRFTRIEMTLPLTLAIIDGLLVRQGEGRFVLPLSRVRECVEMAPDAIQGTRGRDLILVRGEMVPLVRLGEVFGMGGEIGSSVHVVITDDRAPVGILVDGIEGKIQTVIKSLDRYSRRAEGISGATILGDGSVALIVDIPELIRCAAAEEARAVSGPAPTRP